MEAGRKLAEVISRVEPQVTSLLDAGCGEGTTLEAVLSQVERPIEKVLAFDIVPARVLFAQRYLMNRGYEVDVFAGRMTDIPLDDNSIDVVMTYHAVEPNGGHAREVIRELKRVAKHWLIMVEPCYELADEEGKARMKRLGYATELSSIMADEFTMMWSEKWGLDVNPLNPAMLWKAKCSPSD